MIHQAFPSMGSIKIARLLEDPDSGLQLTLVTGAEGLGRVITSSRIQKPGLALAGYTEHLHPERVQVFGNTEISYLNTLDEATQREAETSYDIGQRYVWPRPGWPDRWER